jgi:hypothetical protein
MQIGDAAALRAAAARAATRRTSSGGARFELPEAPRATTTAAAAPLTSLALVQLQELPDPTRERRRRALRRAGALLDELDALQLRLLDETTSPEDLRGLLSLVRQRGDPTGQPELDALLRQLETRAAVELAKLGIDAFALG